MRKGIVIAVVGAGFLFGIVALPALFLIAVLGGVNSQYAGCADGGVQVQPTEVQTKVDGWTPEQQDNAGAIISVGRSRGRSDRDIKIALMTGMQESGLRMLPYGDADSVNIFQQRTSQGWGTPEQLMDRTYAINKFFSRLEGVAERDSMPLWEAAATVQRPYEPYRILYDQWQEEADKFIASATNGTASNAGTPLFAVAPKTVGRLSGCTAISDSTTLAVVRVAVSQVGTTFLPDNISKSTADNTAVPPSTTDTPTQTPLVNNGEAFVQWAFAQVDVQLPPTASEQLASGGERITDPAQLQEGDAVYWAVNPSDLSSLYRSGIYLGDNQIIEASQDNPAVRITPADWRNFAGAIRPIKAKDTFTAEGWRMPVDGEISMTSPFGYRTHPILGTFIFHDGVDLGEDSGTPVYAACSGTMNMAGDNGGYGNYVGIDCSEAGVEIGYGHLSAFADGDQVGKRVNVGDLVGYVGSTGNSTGPHLHFLMHINSEPADPILFLQEKGVRV